MREHTLLQFPPETVAAQRVHGPPLLAAAQQLVSLPGPEKLAPQARTALEATQGGNRWHPPWVACRAPVPRVWVGPYGLRIRNSRHGRSSSR